MGVESELWGKAGGCFTVTHKDKAYQLSPITGAIKAKFEKKLYDRFRRIEEERRVEENRSFDDHLARMNQLSEDYLFGNFDIMSPRGLKYIAGLPGMVFLMALLCGCEDENEVYGLFIEKQAELVPLIMTIIRESFPGFDIDKFMAEKKGQQPQGQAQTQAQKAQPGLDVAMAIAGPLTADDIKAAGVPK